MSKELTLDFYAKMTFQSEKGGKVGHFKEKVGLEQTKKVGPTCKPPPHTHTH